MSGSSERIAAAFAHQRPDRTPLFEIFQKYHPIFWPICGRTIATDAAMAWDARADGVGWQELLVAETKAYLDICRYFDLDMIHFVGTPPRNYPRPAKTGPTSWQLDGTEYVLNERTRMVEYANPSQELADSAKVSEEELIDQIEAWDGSARTPDDDAFVAHNMIRCEARKRGHDWVCMGETGAGTGVAFYPPFQLMWMIEKPELLRRWLEMKKAHAFEMTKALIVQGCGVIAIGGDVSCDKGPFISPGHYREFVLPVIREHVELIHSRGALAVYTSDGNHWPIKEDFFFSSGIDGYKEVDYAAGMTMKRLNEEGVSDRVCIVGNIDARHTLCLGDPEQVRQHVLECLEAGQQTPGGHILHASHSVHEDVKPANYIAAVNAYREFFSMEALPA